MANKITTGGSSSGIANVNTDFELLVALSKVLAKAGYAALVGQNDAGTVTGAAQARAIRASLQQRMSAGIDTLLDSDIFNYVAQHSGKSTLSNTNFSTVFGSGFFQLNSGALTTTGSGTLYQTRQFFPIPYEGGLILEMNIQVSAVGGTNQEFYVGWFLSSSATAIPLDGVYFKVNSTGIFGVSNSNGSETSTSVFTATLSANTNAKFKIVVNARSIDFYVNDVLQASQACGAGLGSSIYFPALPVGFQFRNTGVASVGTILKIANYAIWSNDTNSGKPYQTIKALQGNSYQGQQGGTMGSNANYANSTNPGAAVATNTTAALGTGLGGQFWETDTLAVTTDGIICSYQNPAAAAGVPGKNLIVNGVWIDSYIQTALTGGGYNDQWSIAYGHTAVSLATAEAAAAKAPRRVSIGSRTVASGLVALSQLTRLYIQFVNPIVVYPGEFFAIVKKKVGTAPSAGVVAHNITIDHYLE